MGKLTCFLDTLRRSIPQILKLQPPIMGHPYYETYQNDDVQILKCMRCGSYSIGYYGEGEPQPPEVSYD